MKSACGQKEITIAELRSECNAGLVNLAEAHANSQTAKSKAFTGGGLLLCHDTKAQLRSTNDTRFQYCCM